MYHVPICQVKYYNILNVKIYNSINLQVAVSGLFTLNVTLSQMAWSIYDL